MTISFPSQAEHHDFLKIGFEAVGRYRHNNKDFISSADISYKNQNTQLQDNYSEELSAKRSFLSVTVYFSYHKKPIL